MESKIDNEKTYTFTRVLKGVILDENCIKEIYTLKESELDELHKHLLLANSIDFSKKEEEEIQQ